MSAPPEGRPRDRRPLELWPLEPAEFRFQPGLRGVISGLGCVRARLGAEVAAQEVRHPLIVCGANVAVSPVLDLVRRCLPDDARVFAGSQPHSPVETINAGAAAARAWGADGLVAVGGSSAIDCAKGIAVLLASATEDVLSLPSRSLGHLGDPAVRSPLRPVPLLMVSTTLSFAEFLPFWGTRRADIAQKTGYPDFGLVERTVFLDGEVATHTPDHVWNETGVKALDDALFTYCRAAAPEPFVEPLLGDSIAALFRWLPMSRGSDQAKVRQQVFSAVWMTKFPLPRLGPPDVAAWFSMAARHALGGLLALPHGLGSCVALPVGLRFHARATRARQMRLAEVLESSTSGAAPLSSAVEELFARLAVPTRLSHCGVDADHVDGVVERMLAEAPALGTPAAVRAACLEMQ